MVRDTLEKKLAAPTIRLALQRAGMFLIGWELLKADIEDGVRQFFEITPGTMDPRYATHVLSRDKHTLQASVLWLVDQGALTEEQGKRVQELRQHRNEIAHRLAELLVDPSQEIKVNLLVEMAIIIRAVGAFFGRIAVETNNEFDGKELSDDDIYSGTSLLMAHLVAACEDTSG